MGAEVVVVGEAPGRLGADASELPFHGDKAGHNFESLIETVGIDRSRLFITNAVLCNPKDEAGNNATPKPVEISNCAPYLKDQIDLIDPKIVVTLGAVALRSVGQIHAHNRVLNESVRSSIPWYGRELIPLYHPGQRAMIHRSFANQLADYQYVAERLARVGRRRSDVQGASSLETVALAEAIVGRFGPVSYFALHKLLYLSEYIYSTRNDCRLTNAYFVRQKDGPYCVDLHPVKMARAGSRLHFGSRNGSYRVHFEDQQLFTPPLELDRRVEEVVEALFRKYYGLSEEKLKTSVYLTRPMRSMLRKERAGSNQFNAPINFLGD